MVSHFLVTTALEETWPIKNESILFLGEWCKHHNRKMIWKELDSKVEPYHWDDRKKLYKDYLYLQELFEDLLIEITVKLNEIHKTNHSIRYWRIIIGPWLGCFIQMLFDRYTMVHQAIENNKISGARVIRRKQDEYIPNDMVDFENFFMDDPWNELIYGQILAWMKIPIEIIDVPNTQPVCAKNICKKPFADIQLTSSLKQIAYFIFNILSRDHQYFFISSYIPIKQEFYLQIKLGQIPKIWRSVAAPKTPVNNNMRKWRLAFKDHNSDFEILLRSLIPKQIPKVYLEGYKKIVTLTESMPWPKKPKVIFSSNSFYSDDTFKVWAAKKNEMSTPIVIGQHGGNYGIALWTFLEDHEVTIADSYLTWGWNTLKQNKITPIGNLKGFGKKIIANKSGNALLVEMAIPQLSYYMYSGIVSAGQWKNYFEDNCRFVEGLSKILRENLLVRCFPNDFNYNQNQRWKERFPSIQLDNGAQPITSLMSKSRLYISSYNSTGYLEAMSFNFPTIIFWNPKHWELRNSAVPYFEELKSVGIFHETPESAARQMTAIWDDVEAWWKSNAVQLARHNFCKRYAHNPNEPLDAIKKLLSDVALKAHI